MPIKVKAQGKTFTFPDGTTQEQIGQALDEHFSGALQSTQQVQQPTQGLTTEQLNQLEQMQLQADAEQLQRERDLVSGPGQAFLVGAGKGMTDVGRGIGNLVMPGQPYQPQPGEVEAFETLKRTNPVTSRAGEFVGETVATAPAGGLAGSFGKKVALGTAAKLGAPQGGRLATTAGLIGGGAAEGAAVAAQLGEDVGTGAALGAGANVLLPVIGRASKRLFQRMTGKTTAGEVFDQATGQLTPEAASELEKAGIPLETFSGEVEAFLKQNFDPNIDLAAQLRQSQLAEFAPDVQGRTSRITQDQATQNAEEALIQMGAPEGQNILRQEGLVQEALQSGVERKILGDIDVNLISKFNTVSDDANRGLFGESAKTALREIRDIEKSKVNGLYKAARDLAGDGQQLTTTGLQGAFEEAANDLAANDNTIGAVGRALKEFGVVVDGGDLKAPREIKDLTLDNAELLRQKLNRIDPRDGSQDALFVDIVRRQLDDEVDLIIDSFPEEAAAAAAFKEARKASANYKQTFNDKELIGKLMNFKKGSTDDVVSSEKVLSTLMSSDLKSVQKVKSLMLEKSTPASRQAWNEMKFTVIDEIMRGAMDKQKGVISGQRLNTELAKIGDSRLKLLLGNDKFNQVKRFQKVLSDQTIPLKRLENPSGTSGPVIAMLGAVSDVMRGSADAATGGFVTSASKATAKRKAIESALKDIQTATGHSGRVKRLKAQKEIADFFRELGTIGTATTGAEADDSQP